MKIKIEHTDTFGGDANYSWVNREEIEVPNNLSDLAIVRRAKKELGYSNHRCNRSDWGGTIVLDPVGECTRIFIDCE
jgi:hypothetical protein